MLQLSEHLFPMYEVIISLIQSIISKRSVKECLYWLIELHSSIDTISDSLLCIYHLFFAVGNKGLDGYIYRKLNIYATRPDDITALADIVCALRTSQPSIDAYIIWISATSELMPTKVYKTPFTNCRFVGLIRSICHSDCSNAGVYLRLASSSVSYMRIVDEIVSHFNIDKLDTLKYGGSDIIYTCAMIANAIPIKSEQKNPHNFVRASPSMVNEIVEHFNSEPKQKWLKLTHRRLYPTHSTVLGRPHETKYSRYEVEDIASSCWYSWEYYCYNSRLWNKRFKTYDGTKDDISKKVVFPNDDTLEAFYENGNALEFDEQSLETQMMSLHPLTIISEPLDWFQLQINNRVCNQFKQIKI